MKKRIAVWMHGGIGTGHFSQGYPALEKLLVGLSPFFEIVIYSQYAINKEYKRREFSIRSAPVSVKVGIVRWFYLMIYFLRDHQKNKFHLIFGFWGYPAGFLVTFLSRIVNIPSAVYLLGSDAAGIKSINFGILHKPITRRIALWIYRRTTLLLGISEFQKVQLSAFGINDIKIIPWGIEKDNYKFIDKKHGLPLHIIHVAHLSPVKDQVTLIKAFALIAKQRTAELRIFGEDFLNGSIQKLCKELGVENQVEFLHVIPYNEMPEQYAWADMMLHTSVSEGQSMAMTEAAASGVLLAGTRVGLLHDLGEDCGIVVEVGDYEGLASKVLNLLDDNRNWEQKIKNARQWTETHDLLWTIKELKDQINSILKNPNGS